MLIIFSGHPEACRILCKVCLWMLSKALSRSMKLMCTLVFHSIHCSVIFQRVKMWSMHPTSGLKPACSFLKMVLIASLSLIWMFQVSSFKFIKKLQKKYKIGCTTARS